MSDKLYIIPIERLFKGILEEEKTGQMFGISNRLFFNSSTADPFRMERYGQTLETPIGVAAGPHTQMTQNIIAAWLTGSRYIELKTVQTLDELEVSKPCIDMEDEGYNCEWSQELKLQQSYDQYLDAWIILHILRHKWGLNDGNGKEPGFIFNLSVGYNMEGILKPNVQEFLDKMGNCKQEKEEKLERLAPLYPPLKDLDIPDCMSNNITLSTMHGCPPGEIEKIGKYLIEQQGYHTSIKLNPTLLGPERLREILHQKLGFTRTIVPDEAFGHDLKYDDAVGLIRSLQKSADEQGVDFGLKLTNTLESVNHRDVFPEKETMMYLSGKPLHPISINVAAQLQETFNGELDLSFCAGVDCYNLAEVIAAGLKPVTVCSDLLKPGGYGRQLQYLEFLAAAMKQVKAGCIDSFILNSHGGTGTDVKAAALENLIRYACSVIEEARYRKDFFPGRAIKTSRKLEYFDCIEAPCQTTCPTHQGVPDYMFYTAKGDYRSALEVILETNPFPTVTGMVCDHPCTFACTRVNYDAPLRIRDVKRFVAEQVQAEPKMTPVPPVGVKVAIIGAGPSGLACAFFLARKGVEVKVYEAHNVPGGMVSATIPAFRLRAEDIQKDIRRIENLGVKIYYSRKIDKPAFNELLESNDFVYIAVGAQTASRLGIEGEDLEQVTDALSFLKRTRQNLPPTLGKRVAVIGGGNSAVDAARTAWRMNKGEDAEVVMLYRRTRAQMPAEPEEIDALLEEGILLKELTTPVKITQEKDRLKVTCVKMELGDPDETGRRRPLKIEGSQFDLLFDTVITAIGQQVVLDFLDAQDGPLSVDNETRRLQGSELLSKVFIGGDALHGPLNIVTAIGDGRNAAEAIMNASPVSSLYTADRGIPAAEYRKNAAVRTYGEEPQELTPEQRRNFEIVISPLSETEARNEAARCLLCSDVCDVCVTVCPNRANISYTVQPVVYRLQKAVNGDGSILFEEDGVFRVTQKNQVLNIADFCNECGNCDTFCPTGGAPYKDKPKLCLTEESFNDEPLAFMTGLADNKPFIKWKQVKNGNIEMEQLTIESDCYLYETGTFSARLDTKTLRIQSVDFKDTSVKEARMFRAAEMSIFLPLSKKS
jgi:putative selenate reductase